MFFKQNRTSTRFVYLDTKKCNACWKCITNCPNNVIEKVDFFRHKHALIAAPDACTGCLKCMKVCESNAVNKIERANQDAWKLRNRTFNNFVINNVLLFTGLMVILSGLVLQIGFHMHTGRQFTDHDIQTQEITHELLNGINTNQQVWNLGYSGWSNMHKILIVFFSLLMGYHIFVHWKWYKGVITKHHIGKNRLVMILTVLFLLVFLTGLIAWFIDLASCAVILRKQFIEIHDKITLIFIVFLILHLIKKAGWFTAAFARLRKQI
ncbi:MAG: 4Fe-4S dicluster domain-containing protein [Ignavibacteriales bacterium]|nr:4Fe-4S dicluster domain-containing protein [Ignavibacteriales bacterium]